MLCRESVGTRSKIGSMREVDISELVGIWFHDVKVDRVGIDYVKRNVVFDCVIPVGFWNTPKAVPIWSSSY